MCLIVLAFRSDPQLPLVVAANRDEFHARPTQAAGWWPDQRDILGGRDLLAGGSWLALHRNGRFAAVTNFRDAEPKQGTFRSRGDLVAGFLQGDLSPGDYLDSIRGKDYNGFNLLVASVDELGYMSNQGGAPQLLPPGIYGLANARLDSPCDKVQRSKQRLADLIRNDDVNDTSLMRLLGDREKGPPGEVDASRLPFATAHATTAPFIVMPEFGTRCSTLVSADSKGTWRFLERRFDPAGVNAGESPFSFAAGKYR